MDCESKIHLGEGVPLNTTGGANIFLNTGKSPKVNSQDGTVIHLKTEKPSDLGVHINTTFSIASSKKIKLLFVVNFLLSMVCMVISCSMAFYYWNEMISMKRQIDMIKDHLFVQSLGPAPAVSSALVAPRHDESNREPRTNTNLDNELPKNTQTFYVEDLGDDMLFVDLKKKNASNKDAKLTVLQRDLLVAQFNGAIQEFHMGNRSMIGPWLWDKEVSSKNSQEMVELNDDYVTIKQNGLYLVYAQIVYLSQSPNMYFMWAGQGDKPRLLTTCASADVATPREIKRSQMSCSVQTVARLYKGDVINIAQREPNRVVLLRPGYSYFGFVKISS